MSKGGLSEKVMFNLKLERLERGRRRALKIIPSRGKRLVGDL